MEGHPELWLELKFWRRPGGIGKAPPGTVLPPGADSANGRAERRKILA
jgi:hypothetical protein